MILHPAIIAFNCLGWIWKKTRAYNLILLLLTGASWFVLGIWKGWGYCICTDWHFRVLTKLGYEDLPNSYITFFIQRISGVDVNANLVDILTLTVYVTALLLSIAVNLNARTAKRIRNPRQ
jgi:hypothetical protein